MVEPPLAVPELTRAITRGVARLLVDHGFAVLTEFTLATGRRLDVVAIDRGGAVLAVEVKASVADFRGDRKWPDYLEHCDSFHFVVGPDFPRHLLPDDPRCGVIVADRFGAEILRPPEPVRLAAARRKAVTLRFAHTAAARLQVLLDPSV